MVRRKGLKDPAPAWRGFQLLQGDLVMVGTASNVAVFCFPGMRRYDWSSGDHKIDCGSRTTPVSFFAKRFNQARAQIGTIKNHTGISTTRPKGTTPQYCLSKIIETRPISWGTSISLKDNSPLLSSDEKDQLVEEIEKLSSSTTSTDKANADAANLLLADVFALRQNYDKAIDSLQKVSAANTDPYIQIMQGDLFLAGGYGQEADDAYKSAIEIAKQNGDNLAQAVAQHAHGFFQVLVQETPINRNSALKIASLLYHQVGQDQTAEQLIPQLKAGLPTPLTVSPFW